MMPSFVPDRPLELAKTALILERLLGELQSRLVEIEKGRKGSKDTSVEAVTKYLRLALQQSGDLSLPNWATAKPVFLGPADSIEAPLPLVTPGYKTRWSFITELRDDERSLKMAELSRKSKKLRSRDFSSTVDVDGKEATFDFIDPRASGLVRHFFARKALSCLQKVRGEADLFRAQALRLAGKNEVAAKLIREHAAPASLPLSHQIMTLDTSIAGYEQSLRIEAARLEGSYKATSKDGDLPFSELRTSLGRVLDARTSDMKSIILKDVDPVVLSRDIQKKLAVDGVSDESTTSNLVSRYVDEVLRRIADVYFAKGEFARSAQIRRRIGGSEAFKVGPKVPPTALATCALEHWKIVEPRSALRYLKDLEKTFPNAKRASGLLRDVLSYRGSPEWRADCGWSVRRHDEEACIPRTHVLEFDAGCNCWCADI